MDVELVAHELADIVGEFYRRRRRTHLLEVRRVPVRPQQQKAPLPWRSTENGLPKRPDEACPPHRNVGRASTASTTARRELTLFRHDAHRLVGHPVAIESLCTA